MSTTSKHLETHALTPIFSVSCREHLRRLVLACQWEATRPRQHTIPTWLLQSVLDLARSRDHYPGGLDPILPRLIIEIIHAKKSARVFCAYDAAVDIAMLLADRGTEVALDLQSPELAVLCSCLAVAADLPLQVRQGDPFALARTDMHNTTEHKPSHDVAIVNPPFNVRYPAILEDVLGTNLPAPMNSEAVDVTLALARGRDVAVCLLPPSFLFQASKASQAFKERAVYDYGLDTVISLPMGTLRGTPLPPALVIFRPALAEQCDPQLRNILMVDARGDRPRSGGTGYSFGFITNFATEFGADPTANAFWSAVSADATSIENGETASAIASDMLWPNSRSSSPYGVPEPLWSLWQEMQAALVAANEDWQVWTTCWYEDRLRGSVQKDERELAYVQIDDDLWDQGPAAVNAEVKRRIEKLEPPQRTVQAGVSIIAVSSGRASVTLLARRARHYSAPCPSKVPLLMDFLSHRIPHHQSKLSPSRPLQPQTSV